MEHLKPPEPLDFDAPNLANEWRKWKNSWDIYALASGVSEKPEPVQCAVFLHVAGPSAQQINSTFVFTDEQKDDITELISKFEAYCQPRQNETFERYVFRTTMQNKRSFDSFLTDLKQKAQRCGFKDLEASMIRDQVVLGVDESPLRERLLRESELTLQKATHICRAAEQGKMQMQAIAKEEQNCSADAVYKRKSGYSNRNKPKPRNDRAKTQDENCSACGNTKHGEKDECPAFGATCFKCGFKNHFSQFCRTRKQKRVDYVNSKMCADGDKYSSESDDNTLNNDEVTVDSVHCNEIHVKIQVNCVKGILFKVDTGCARNIINKETYEKAGKPRLSPTKTQFVSYGGNVLPMLGKCKLTIKAGGKELKCTFYVTALKQKNLLSLKTSLDLEMITLNDIVAVHQVEPKPKPVLERYADVFKGLGCVEGTYDIKLDKSVQPTIQPPHSIALSLLPRLKAKLEHLQRRQVISAVNEPTDWVSNLVVREKANGTLRLCLNPPDLNKAIKREHYKPPSIEMISSKLHGMKVFSVVDMSDCYWHQKLTAKSSLLCTFNTPFGRMKFNRMPFGISCASDVAQKMVDRHFGDLPGVLPVHDDIVVAGRNETEHDENLERVLERARERNIKFNREKIQYRVSQVKYMGELVSDKGFSADPEKIRAITEYPKPENQEDLQRLLGMVNFVSKYLPNMSAMTQPLRQLLRKETMWSWNHEHDQALSDLRNALSTQPVLAYYKVESPAVLQVDASKKGLGACLMQNGRPIAYASRSLTSAEENYANIERELLAIVFACERFHQYIYGKKDVVVNTDHKPLEHIHLKSLAKSPPRLQRLLLKLQKYHITVKWVPGKQVKIADALSRAPLQDKTPTLSESDENDITLAVHALQEATILTENKMAALTVYNQTDKDFLKIQQYICSGWPNSRRQVKPSLQKYWDVKNDIHLAENILMVENRILIPESWQSTLLKMLHATHCGIEKTKARARQAVYWPGMNKDIAKVVETCDKCLRFRKKNAKEPLMLRETPTLPWQYICSDIMEHEGNIYVVVNDYYSRFLEVEKIRSKTTQAITGVLKKLFARHGIPEKLFADNMPYNSREMHFFAETYDFRIVTSSPNYPQSNGLAEKSVGIAKQWLKKSCDLQEALMDYRNTPLSGTQYTPAQLLYSRMCRTKVPVVRQSLKPKLVENVAEMLYQEKMKQKHFYDGGSKSLKDLKPGQVVQVQKPGQHEWTAATVKGKLDAPRSYVVTTGDNSEYRRNRKHLQIRNTTAPPIIPKIDEFFHLKGEEEKESHGDTSDVQGQVEQDTNNCAERPQQVVQDHPRQSARSVKKPVWHKDYVVG